LLRAVLVNMKHDDDSALRGVLWQSRGPWLVLRDVSAIKSTGQPMAIDGDVIVHRDNIAFIQVLP
jgi:hypothetical protein